MTPSASPLARSTIHRLYLTSAFGEQHEEALFDEVGETRDREGDNGGGGVSRNAGSPGMQASDGICSAPPRLASGRAATAFPALPAGDVTVARRDMRTPRKRYLIRLASSKASVGLVVDPAAPLTWKGRGGTTAIGLFAARPKEAEPTS
jgi:hypothetical protein